MWGETIVPCGGAAAHILGLTTQVPVRSVYLTSGPDRRLRFGSLEVELRHAPRWQLTAPRRRAGDVIRALAWLGRAEIQEGLRNCSAGPLSRGYRRACRGAGDHAALDGGAGECPCRAWLSCRSSRWQPATGGRH